MTIEEYIKNLNQRYKAGNATEHTFRGYLQQLIESLNPKVKATNEPKREGGNAPDYVISKKGIGFGWIEAKDIGDKDLDGEKNNGNKEQFDRYKIAYENIIFTDYVVFHYYREGEKVAQVSIADVTEKGIRANSENFSQFQNMIQDFTGFVGQTIKNPKQLAEMMAGKARILSHTIREAVTSDEKNHENSTIKEQMKAFREILIHDITPEGFADVYAQTIAYGMFAARLHDPTLETFSRQEAAELIPKSNPFLRKLFGYIAGPDIDDRIKRVVDSLVDIFLHCNVEEILKDYGKTTQTEDPIIHFYETFLSVYNPEVRTKRGVYYTPQPVVNFIVRAVDDILKTEFGLLQGLADTSKTKIKVDEQGNQVEKEVHKVQILDPAAGTGTFLAEVVRNIHSKFAGQEGIWNSYVEDHLLPRLNGFELLMASYAMAHLKLDLLLQETGFTSTQKQRLRVFLTNSLEEQHPYTGLLFANWLSEEAKEANYIKRDTPVMCVIGNPPYSGISSNNIDWIKKLVDDYKYIDGVHFNERKHWLNDDYVKFIRYGQHYIEKNGCGVLAFINPHGFLDNPTFRGMRWNLLNAFDTIYTIDLHGNSNKLEKSPDGSIDENVFDIKTGVSINIFIKKEAKQKQKKKLADVFHCDLYGDRESKYEFLNSKNLNSINFNNLKTSPKDYFFIRFVSQYRDLYYKSISILDLFNENGVGFVTATDSLNISFSESEHKIKIEEIIFMNEDDWRNKYNRSKDAQAWKYEWAKRDAKNNKNLNLQKVLYRPFDIRYTLYTGVSGGLYARPTNQVMKHLNNRENIGLVTARSNKSQTCDHFYISKYMMETKCGERTTQSAIFPLYLYNDEDTTLTETETSKRTPNLNQEIVNEIAQGLDLAFTLEKESKKGTFAPIDILDYIYAVLHSPAYREKFKEFLKIDFPRVPYPTDPEVFWKLVALGGKIREIHLLESPLVEKYTTKYPISGENQVEKIQYKEGNVYINESQYFSDVPEVAWNFYIGGYQPAQKWLKDRKGRKLDFEDILHYQKIIVALVETDRLMQEIDEVVEF